MKKMFVVVDDTGNISYGFPNGNENQDAEPESFDDKAAAETRAAALARSEPGKAIGVYQLVSTTCADISEPVTRTAA